MYNNDVCKGVVYAYETYEAKKRVAAFRSPVCFMNFGLIPDRHRYCTYLYYSRVGYPGRGSSNLSTAQSPHPRALGARGPRSRSSAEMTRSHLLSDSSSGRPGAQPAVRHKQNLPLALGRSRSDTCTRRLRSPLGKRGTGRILPAEGEMIVKPTFLGSMQFSLGRPVTGCRYSASVPRRGSRRSSLSVLSRTKKTWSSQLQALISVTQVQ